MKVTYVTFIFLFSCALVFGLCSYVSIFCVLHLCWGHETVWFQKQYYLSGLPSVSHIRFLSLTLCLNLREFPLCVNFHSLKTHWVRISEAHWFRISFPKECFPRSTGFLCMNVWAMQGKHAEWFDHLGHSAELAWLPVGHLTTLKTTKASILVYI